MNCHEMPKLRLEEISKFLFVLLFDAPESSIALPFDAPYPRAPALSSDGLLVLTASAMAMNAVVAA